MTSGLIIFLKYPELGKVKTRLAKSIGNQKAFDIYSYLVNNTLTNSKGTHLTELHFQFKLPDNHNFKSYNIDYQKGENIGERMFNSINQMLSKTEAAILIGTDIPEIHPAVIKDAIEILKTKDMVLGPATDGGYYLIGMKKANKQLFELNKWSHSNVLKQTLEIANDQNLAYGFVTELSDLDNIDDLNKFPELKARFLGS